MAAHNRFWAAWQLLTRPLRPDYTEDELQLARACAVVATPFNCYLDGQEPDWTNLDIARLASKYMERYGLPFIGQREHCDLLRAWGIPKSRIFQMETEDGERVMSQRLGRFQAETIRGSRPGLIVIRVGMPEHLGRCCIIDEYHGLTPLVPPECAQVRYDSRLREGMQDWCTDRETFTTYEKTKGRLGSIAFALLGLF
jgi:hypothetical protein